jgi:hypothetical protein
VPGTSLYAQYFRDVQNIVDAGDPLNFVTQAAQQRSIYFQQMVGNAAAVPALLPDQVIPNSATQRLITAITASGQAFPRVVPGQAVPGDGYVNFITGDHGSLLNPGTGTPPPGLQVTTEMQSESFVYTAGSSAPLIPAGTIVPGVFSAVPVQP